MRLGVLGLQFLLASLCDHALAAAGAEPDPVSPGAGAAGLCLCRAASDGLGLRWTWGCAGPRWRPTSDKRPYIIVGMVGFAGDGAPGGDLEQWRDPADGGGGMATAAQAGLCGAMLAGALHFVLLSKVWTTETAGLCCGLALGLLALRLLPKRCGAGRCSGLTASRAKLAHARILLQSGVIVAKVAPTTRF